MATYTPQIRIISVDHDRTVTASQRLQHAMTKQKQHYTIHNVFCHLEAGRCGVLSGAVALEVDGSIVWMGSELTDNLATQFCNGLTAYVAQQTNDR